MAAPLDLAHCQDGLMVATKRQTSSKSVWYLPDAPIKDANKDAFGHADVANNLLTMIREPRRGRLMIGLVGPFGVGKSTVIELLRSSLSGDPDQALIRVSAERHEIEDFHRSFVFSVAERLLEQNLVSREAIDREMQQLEFASTQSQSDLTLSPAFRIARRVAYSLTKSAFRLSLTIAGIVFALLAVTTVVLAATGVFGQAPAATVLGWLGFASGLITLAFAVPLVSSLVFGLKNATLAGETWKPGQRSSTRPRAEAADEYERTFARLVDLVDKRLVIAVDDIDRMASSDILSALNAVRTFQLTAQEQKRPAFIVSVDEAVVTKAMISDKQLPVSNADETHVVEDYLNRLFTQRQQMPPHVSGDLRAFARDVLAAQDHEGAKKLGNQLESVLNVLIHDGVHDPRHVIRILNGYFGDYRLAYHREQHTESKRAMSSELVTARPLVLARMTVLRLDFPKFHAILTTDTRYLEVVEAIVRGESPTYDEVTFHRDLGAPLESEGFGQLKRFIGRTATLAGGEDDLLPFLYLGQSKVEKSVGSKDARLAKSLLANRQISELGALLDELQSAPSERQLPMVEFLVDATRTLDGFELDNAIEALVANGAKVAELNSDLGAAVADALYRDPNASPDVNGLISLLPTAQNESQQLAISRALASSEVEGNRPWISALMDRREEIGRIPASEKLVDNFLIQEMTDLGTATSIADVEEYLPHLLKPGNDGIAGLALTALFRVAKAQPEDITEESAVIIGDLALQLPTGTLGTDLTGAMSQIIADGTTSNAAKAGIDIVTKADTTDPKEIAQLGWAFIRGSMDTETGQLKPQIKHDHLELGEDLLMRTIEHANSFTAEKRKLTLQICRLLAGAVASLETTYPVMDKIAKAASKTDGSVLSPLVQPMLQIWTEKDDALDDDEVRLIQLLAERVDSLPGEQILLMKSSIGTALLPTAEAYTRDAAIGLLPILARTSKGSEWLPDFIDSTAGALTNTQPVAAVATTTLLALSANANEKVTDANATNVLSALTGRMIPFGLFDEALDVLVGFAWPTSPFAATAVGLIEQNSAQLSDVHLLELFRRLVDLPSQAFTAAFLTYLRREGSRLVLRDENRIPAVANLLRLLPTSQVIEVALDLGDRSLDKFEDVTRAWDATQKFEAASAAPALVAASPSEDSWRSVLSEKLAQLEPAQFAKGVDALVSAQLEDGDVFTTRDYALLIGALDSSGITLIASRLEPVLSGSAHDLSLAIPIIAAIGSSHALDIALGSAISASVVLWVRERKDAPVAVRLAEVAKKGPHTRAQSLEAIGPRGPRNEPAKSTYKSVRDALT